jgi:imidazolonepropionase-like amidohydrolase
MVEAEHGALLASIGACIFDSIGPTLKDGTILAHGGWVGAIGPRQQITPPGGAEVIDLSGRWVIPRLVDSTKF